MNPCDMHDCPRLASHEARDLSTGETYDLCDEHLPGYLAAGGVHVRWLDRPRYLDAPACGTIAP